jgi:MraZ protein
MTKGQEGCITVWPEAAFREVAEAMSRQAFTDRRSRTVQRLFLADATAEVPDKQGRITVPQVLRDYAALDRDVVVIGMTKRVEIWDAARWAAYQEAESGDYEQLAEEVLPSLLQ